jgi:hypothetical protein
MSLNRSNPLGAVAESLEHAAVFVPLSSNSRKRSQAQILDDKLKSTSTYPQSAWNWPHYIAERSLSFQAGRNQTRLYPMRNILDLKIQLIKLGRIQQESHIGSQAVLKECEALLKELHGEFRLPQPAWISARESQGFENANRSLISFLDNWDPVAMLKKKINDPKLELTPRSVMDIICRIGKKSAEEKELMRRQEELNKARHLLGEYFKDVKVNLFGNVEIINFSRSDDMPEGEKRQLCKNVREIIIAHPELVFLLIELCPSAVRGIFPELVRLSENEAARSLMIHSIYGV